MGLQGSNDFDDCREDLVEGGKCAAPKSAMPQIEKERNWAKANQLPAGPRKKRPLGRLFSSKQYRLVDAMLSSPFQSGSTTTTKM